MDEPESLLKDRLNLSLKLNFRRGSDASVV